MNLQAKLDHLRQDFRNAGKVLLAFSGGVDSSLLACIGQQELGDNLRAITVDNGMQSQFELNRACSLAQVMGIRHEVLKIDALQLEQIRENSLKRCYYCKNYLFSQLLQIAEQDGSLLIEGSHLGDQNGYRPGQQALLELGVLSPLKDADLNKGEIRELARVLGLPNWDAPASPCLATRFPYGQTLSPSLIQQVGDAEDVLRQEKFREFRVRVHDDLARIEVGPEELERFMDLQLMKKIDEALRRLGFVHVCLDLSGFRSGAMDPQVAEGKK